MVTESLLEATRSPSQDRLELQERLLPIQFFLAQCGDLDGDVSRSGGQRLAALHMELEHVPLSPMPHCRGCVLEDIISQGRCALD
jgi:hypothetical protein